MKRWTNFLSIFLIILITGCSAPTSAFEKTTKIGILLPDGLGDRSLNDSAFYGLEKARDELGILFDYIEPGDEEDYKTGLVELIEQDNDLIISLGTKVKNDLKEVAQQFPQQQFVIIDSQIDLPNVWSIQFKEDEGSFLIGALAGIKTNTDTVAFIGGEDTPVTRKYLSGFKQGVAATNRQAVVLDQFTGSFDDYDLGAKTAFEVIREGADYLYTTAGMTGEGVINKAEETGVYSFGADSDQFFTGEKTVVSSMIKNVDKAIYIIAEEWQLNGHLPSSDLVLGLKEDGVGIAPVRNIAMTESEKERLKELTNKVKSSANMADE
ncbi:basic membrane protein A [Gracilibacillus ureilyticus]|uniref:Basic membrane protein A n=1 Tax=Gracilibacillus ureilyticus TaxID=531814 RepID=A0A1H9TKB3_9BACI|nr:BMP family ABC transporter substrate-binding protein [Gracilibacillus ureilyticus]SER97601.1 basic membrane protein A [Gracilibacillus ureilyticus]